MASPVPAGGWLAPLPGLGIAKDRWRAWMWWLRSPRTGDSALLASAKKGRWAPAGMAMTALGVRRQTAALPLASAIAILPDRIVARMDSMVGMGLDWRLEQVGRTVRHQAGSSGGPKVGVDHRASAHILSCCRSCRSFESFPYQGSIAGRSQNPVVSFYGTMLTLRQMPRRNQTTREFGQDPQPNLKLGLIEAARATEPAQTPLS